MAPFCLPGLQTLILKCPFLERQYVAGSNCCHAPVIASLSCDIDSRYSKLCDAEFYTLAPITTIQGIP